MTPYDAATIELANILQIEWFNTTVQDRYKNQTFKKTAVASIRKKSLVPVVDLYLYGNIEIEIEFNINTEIGGVKSTNVDELYELLNNAIYGTPYTP